MKIKTPEQLLKQRLLNDEIETAAKVLAEAIFAIIEATWNGDEEWTEFKIDRLSMQADLPRQAIDERASEILSHHQWSVELGTDDKNRFRPNTAATSVAGISGSTEELVRDGKLIKTATADRENAKEPRKKSIAEMFEDAIEVGLAFDQRLSERCFLLDLNDVLVWITRDVAKIEQLIELTKLYERDRFLKSLYAAANGLENEQVTWEVRQPSQGIPSITLGKWLEAEKAKSNYESIG